MTTTTTLTTGELEQLATGCIWSEGPLWIPGERCVRWSDIHNNRIMRWDAATGESGVHREGVEFTNGRALDRDGSVVQCSHGNRRIEREDADGTVTAIADAFGSHRLNSPNDVAIAPDGSYWFTDPDYGIVKPEEGHAGEREYQDCWVFRFSEEDGIRPVVVDMDRPNGIAFSPGGSVLYVTDTGEAPGIRAYDVDGVRAKNGRPFARVGVGVSDGIAIDVDGRVWSSAGDGVHVFDADGAELEVIPVPEIVANVCFGGDDGSELFIAATTSLYRVRTTTRGL